MFILDTHAVFMDGLDAEKVKIDANKAKKDVKLPPNCKFTASDHILGCSA